MPQRRYLPTNPSDLLQIQASVDQSGPGRSFRQNIAPRPDDKRVTEGFPSILVATLLGRCNHKRPCLDGPRPQKNMPMSLPRDPGEGRGNGNDMSAGLRKIAVEMRKTHIITDSQTNAPARNIGDDSLASGGEAGWLVFRRS